MVPAHATVFSPSGFLVLRIGNLRLCVVHHIRYITSLRQGRKTNKLHLEDRKTVIDLEMRLAKHATGLRST